MPRCHERTPQSADYDEPVEIDVGDPAFPDGAFDLYAAMRKGCPVHRAVVVNGGIDGSVTGPLGRPFWAVTGYDEATAALLDDQLGVDPLAILSAAEVAAIPAATDEFRPLFRNLLLLDPPDHTRLRRLVQPSFTALAVEAWRPRVQQIADDLLDTAERGAASRGEATPERTMDLVVDYALPLPITVIFELLGIPLADRERVHTWTEELLRVAAGADDEAQRAGLRPFLAYGRALVASKRAEPADDLLTQMIRAEEDGDRLDEDELLSMIFLLVLAGHVTTVNLIASGVFALLTHPSELAKVRADPGLVAGAVEETLRLWGPIELASERFAKIDIDVGGVSIRRGETVVPVLAAANHDPARFGAPERFDISRTEGRRHLAFGKGVHACLGAPLARLEGQIALGTLIDRYADLRLAVEPSAVTWQAGVLRGVTRLPIRF